MYGYCRRGDHGSFAYLMVDVRHKALPRNGRVRNYLPCTLIHLRSSFIINCLAIKSAFIIERDISMIRLGKGRKHLIWCQNILFKAAERTGVTPPCRAEHSHQNLGVGEKCRKDDS